MQIPTFDEAYTKTYAGNPTPLERFIFDNEPEDANGDSESRMFREGLQAVVDSITGPLEAQLGLVSDEVLDELGRYRETLRFYANHETWNRSMTKESAPYTLSPPIANDFGKAARAALGIPELEHEIPFN